MSEGLGAAARAGDLARAQALVAVGVDPNSRDERGSVLLYGIDDVRAAEILIAVGADPNVESDAE